MGGQVTHPALLDWLSIDLREHGWATKRLHRVIVSSATYRQISDLRLGIGDSTTAIPLANPKSLDPENTLYLRFPRQPFEREAIRDAMLAAAGLLTTERGGPGVMPPLPEELLGTLLKGQWNTQQARKRTTTSAAFMCLPAAICATRSSKPSIGPTAMRVPRSQSLDHRAAVAAVVQLRALAPGSAGAGRAHSDRRRDKGPDGGPNRTALLDRPLAPSHFSRGHHSRAVPHQAARSHRR